MKVVSQVFHPLLLATYTLALFYWLIPEVFQPVPSQAIPTVILATFVTTFVIPLFSVGILKLTSRVSSLELNNREERILPFISIALFYAAATYMMIEKLYLQAPLASAMLIVTALIFLLFLITLRFKISIHAAAIWGFCGLLSALVLDLFATQLLWPLAVSFGVAGLVSTSRLYLQVHTPTEIWSGAFLGYTFCFGLMYFFG